MLLGWMLGGGKPPARLLADGELRPSRAIFSGAVVGAITLAGSGSAPVAPAAASFSGATVGAPTVAASGAVGVSPEAAAFSGAAVSDPTLAVSGAAPLDPDAVIFAGGAVGAPALAVGSAAPLALDGAAFSGAIVGAPTLTEVGVGEISPNTVVFSGGGVPGPTIAASGSVELAVDAVAFGGVTVSDPTVAIGSAAPLAPDAVAFGGATVGAPTVAVGSAAPLAPAQAVYAGQTVGALTVAVGSAAPLAPGLVAFGGATVGAPTLAASGGTPTVAGQIVESQTLTDSGVGATSKTFTSVSITQADGAGNTGRYQLHALVGVASASAGVRIENVTVGSEVLARDELGTATAANRPATRTFSAGEWATGSQNVVVECSGGNIDSIIVFLFISDEVADECLPPYGTAPRTDTFNRMSLNPMWTLDDADGDITASFVQTGGIIRLNLSVAATAADFGDGSDSNRSPNLHQAIGNVDFDVTTHFETIPTTGTPVIGTHCEESADDFNFLRVGAYVFGGSATQFMDYGEGVGNYTIEGETGTAAANSQYIRLARATNDFDGDNSSNGSTFNNVNDTTLTLTVARVGLNVSTYGPDAYDIDVFEFINNDNAARTPQDAQTALQFLSDTAASATAHSLAFTEDTTEGAALIDIAIVAADDAAGAMSAGTGDELLAQGVISSTDGIRYAIVGALTEVSGTTAGTTIGATWSGSANASASGLQFRVEEV